jgi:hypothetical protein
MPLQVLRLVIVCSPDELNDARVIAIDFYVDNQRIRRINQSPGYPMQFMLAIYELPGAGVNAVYPKKFVVDYVRGYQPKGGY